ncbi:MAG: hypothetical protein U0074_04415 [Kouleothrix sp.]
MPTAPPMIALLRVFVGGSRNPDVMDLEDTALLALVQAELRTVLGLQATPLFSRISLAARQPAVRCGTS